MAKLTNLELVGKLEEIGLLKPLIKAGLFPLKVMYFRDVFLFVDAQKKSGLKTKEAVCKAEIQFKISRSSVFYALKLFK